MPLLSRLLRWLRPAPGDSGPAPLPGEITDWNEAAGVGSVQLADSAVLSFGRGACEGFAPLIGLHVEVRGVGMPPGDQPGALVATTLRVPAAAEAAYAAGLRAQRIEREARTSRGGRGAADAPDAPGQEPRAERQGDGFYVFTLLLERPLPPDPARLADLLRSASLPWLKVRIIPLVRRGRSEPGFSAELKDEGGRRAFLLYRPEPFGDEAAPYHAGLFVGGPHSPRTAAMLGRQGGEGPLHEGGEVRWLGDLLRSLLRGPAGVSAVIVNRAGGVRKPAETALSQLGAQDEPGHAPVLAWIDWNLGALQGRRVQLSSGMESLGLPDVAVRLPEGPEDDARVARSRDALWWACARLCQGALPPEQEVLEVPRGLSLAPGSHLQAVDPADCERYRVESRDEILLVLAPT